MPVRVLAVDDSVLFRTKLQLTLSKDPDIKIVGTAVDADDALRKILELKPDVVTLDVELPKMSGIEFMKTLMKQHPVAVVVVSSLPMNASDREQADFHSRYGVSATKFLETMNSRGVAAQMRWARKFIETSGVQGTPTLIVAGKYRVLGRTKQDMLRIAAQLAAQLRTTRP